MTRIAAVADDLSGAAETASSLAGITSNSISQANTRLYLHANRPDLKAEDFDGTFLVLDADTRRADATEQDQLFVNALAACSRWQHDIFFLKTDSLLRGHLESHLLLLLERGPVVFSPALPSMGRTVLRGQVLVQGKPLHKTTFWAVESKPAPASIAEALPNLPVAGLSLEVLRGPRHVLHSSIAMSIEQGTILIADAETESDLQLLVDACVEHSGMQFAGSAALARALGKLVSGLPPRMAPPGALTSLPLKPTRPPAVICGSASLQAREQMQTFSNHGLPLIVLDANQLLDATPEPSIENSSVANGSFAIGISSETIQPGLKDRLALAFSQLCAPLAASWPCLLTGGETARAILEANNISWLEPLRTLHSGAVLLRTNQQSFIATRPGSFGDAESFINIIEDMEAYFAMLPENDNVRERPSRMESNMQGTELPIVAVTMGDGAGIGPEVIIAAVLDPATLGECRPIVIGDCARLELAASSIGRSPDFNVITDPDQAIFDGTTINVINLNLLPAELEWGKLSAEAGNAAYHYIRVASELALAGKVQAICTAPLNKEALHASGHIYPGHTEMLAALTDTPEVSMMLSTPKIKVIHVTTHIGLVDAIDKIEPGLVYRTISRGAEALMRAGIKNPKIGVCAINPHAGENGLFGYDEEALKIAPGIKAAQEQGINAVGPLPADTLFFLAGRGDYDLVVAMYHDQGHGPVKVLGIESGVNITVGLPVIRTSVDHGTAFDIAGKNIADPRSMIEALHQAAEMATR